MTVAGARVRGAEGVAAGDRGDRSRLATRSMAVAAAVLTAYQLSRPGFLLGTTPDVAAWFGASVRLVHGALPYRDFVLTQPPGFALLASPFAGLSVLTGTRLALAALRLCTPFIAAAGVMLTGRVMRARGTAAQVAACAVMAFLAPQLYALHAGLLEPLVGIASLGAIALAFEGDALAPPPRLLLAGALLGLGVTVKLSALIPLAVLAVFCLAQRRLVVRLLSGAAGVVGVVVLPFALLAPGAFARDAVATQVRRLPAHGRYGLGVRLSDITGLPGNIGAAVAAALLLVLAVAAGAAYARGRRPTIFEWFVLAAAACVLLAQLGPAWYYPQYAALVTPFIALLAGVTLDRLQPGLSARGPALAAAALTAVMLAAAVARVAGSSTRDVAAEVDAAVPPGACVLAYSPAVLVTSDRFVAAPPGCTTMTDPQGTTLAYAGDPAGAAVWQQQFARAEYLVSDGPVQRWQLPWNAALRAYVDGHFDLVSGGRPHIYIREAPPD